MDWAVHSSESDPPLAVASPVTVSPRDQFSPNLEPEHAAHGYRYIHITEFTKLKDVKFADSHNQKMYKSALQAHRQKSLLGSAAGERPTLPEPPRPTNTERFKKYTSSRRKVEALSQTLAVYNLALYGQSPFRDYEVESAVEYWIRFERSLGHAGRPRAVSQPLPIPAHLGQADPTAPAHSSLPEPGLPQYLEQKPPAGRANCN